MPQKSWSKKDERQYEHVKESEKGNPRAKEIAARTVNKQRSEEGRTKNSSSSGNSSSNRGGGNRLEDRTKQQLYERAKSLDIQGRSSMNKSELVQAIRKRS